LSGGGQGGCEQERRGERRRQRTHRDLGSAGDVGRIFICLEHAAGVFVVVRRFDSVNDGQGY
jgi:hypothetical protein